MTRFIKKRTDTKKKTSRKEKIPATSGNDITMCKGGKCPFKDMCYRYTALPDELYQSYFTKPPFKIDNGKPSCEMFWGDAANQLFIVLKEMYSNHGKNKKISKATPEKRKRNSKGK